MTLATHAIAGSLIGAVAAHNPALAVTAGFMSHFLLDAVPHWDYSLGSAVRDEENELNSTLVLNKAFLFDLMKIGFDMLIGFVAVVVVFWGATPPLMLGALLGACAGVAPDFLQFVYFRFPKGPMRELQKFHLFMHATWHLRSRPLLGVGSQVVLSSFVLMLASLYVSLR